MAWRPSHYVATGMLAAAGLVWAVRDAWPGRRPLMAPVIRVDQAYVEFDRALGRSETLSDLLERGGIVGRDRNALLGAATDLPVRRLRPGLVFHFRRLQTDSVADRVTVRVSPERRVRLSRADSGWRQITEAIPWTIARMRVTGAIGTSLYDALDKAVPDRVPSRWASDAASHGRSPRCTTGRWTSRATCIRAISSACCSSGSSRRRASTGSAASSPPRCTSPACPRSRSRSPADATEPAGFYDEHGRSLKRAFLRAPLQFRRVSSGFGARYHPLLHVWRTHEGVDFAAPYGAPVRATADGSVATVGRGDPGYGNLIELRHANGIRTRYGHLVGVRARPARGRPRAAGGDDRLRRLDRPVDRAPPPL
mgnify:CR=1 FL=1